MPGRILREFFVSMMYVIHWKSNNGLGPSPIEEQDGFTKSFSAPIVHIHGIGFLSKECGE